MHFFIKAILTVVVIFALPVYASAQTNITVYKTPTCGCCQKWVEHLTEQGLNSEVISLSNLAAIKSKYAIQGRYRSCHTGVVVTEDGDYVFEGHVPKQHIDSFLNSPPEGALGLAVPGMPVGSPGMEMGDRKDYYQVLLLFKDGSSEVYAHVNQ